jgi:non-heme chloroperoxidase
LHVGTFHGVPAAGRDEAAELPLCAGPAGAKLLSPGRSGTEGEEEIVEGSLRTNDGVTLRYSTLGAGRPVVFVHGWQGSSVQWRPAASELNGCLRVLYDQRGHGESDDSAFGWSVHRLAADLRELLAELELSGVTLVGHSMGCAVIWAYLELFGTAGLDFLVFVDQSPVMLYGPSWGGQEAFKAGAMFTEEQLSAVTGGLRDPCHRADVVRQVVATMVDEGFPAEELERTVEMNLRVDGEYAAALLTDHAVHDWRRQIASIELPTLVVAGAASTVPWQGSLWTAEHIPGSSFELVEDAPHLLMVKTPRLFAHLLSKFLANSNSNSNSNVSAAA